MRDKHRPSVEGPGRDEFQAYIQGDLPEERKKALEAFLSENPIASDALEGLKWVEKPKRVAVHVKRIQQRTQERIHVHKEENPFDTKRTSRVRPDLQWKPFVASMAGLAAMVLVVFMIIFYTRSNQEAPEGIASSQSPATTETDPTAKMDESGADLTSREESTSALTPSSSPPLIAEHSSAQPVNKVNRSIKKEKTQTLSSQVGDRKKTIAPEGVFSPSLEQFNYLEIEVEESLASETSADREKFPERSTALSSQAVLPVSHETEPVELDEVIILDGRPSKEKKVKRRPVFSPREAASPTQADRLDIQQNLVQAPLPQINWEPSSSQEVERTLTANIGIWYFTYDMYSEAEMELQQLLLAQPGEAHTVDWAYSSAQWYLSRIYIATGRTGEAKNLLKKISVYPNPYQNQAHYILRKL